MIRLFLLAGLVLCAGCTPKIIDHTTVIGAGNNSPDAYWVSWKNAIYECHVADPGHYPECYEVGYNSLRDAGFID